MVTESGGGGGGGEGLHPALDSQSLIESTAKPSK